MENLITALILSVVEGVTEFLPVSSTGHLILVGDFLKFTGEKAATWAGRAIGFVATALALPFVAKFGGKAAKTLVKGYASLLKA